MLLHEKNKIISQEEKNQILELGEPVLKFGDRELRLYPNGPLLAHVLGRTQIKEMSSKDVRLEGVSGLEKMFDDTLKKYDFENERTPILLHTTGLI